MLAFPNSILSLIVHPLATGALLQRSQGKMISFYILSTDRFVSSQKSANEMKWSQARR